MKVLRVGNHGQKGFTFVELIFAVVITVLAILVLISHLAISYKQSRYQRDRVFAFMVAKSILAEVQAFAAAGEGSEHNDVDSLDDGINTNPTLSIATTGTGTLLAPDHELSGNSMRGTDWVWSRQITVRPLAGLDNRMLRYVSVRIFKQNEKGVRKEIANLSSVVNSLALSYPSTQVFDVYFLAIENIPGWWVHMEAIRPFMEAMVTDLERNNPGLRIRTHWITKASYGRNPVYRPYINVETDSHSKAEGVYYYPGLMPAGNASSYYYVPSVIKGRVQTDVGEVNGYDVDRNPYPYALADFFNHGMRHPREKAFHDLRIQAIQNRKAAIETAQAAGTPVPDELWDMSEEPTYRLFLEDLCTNPDKYRNALILNLHGELIPMPSIRNYSDAAKSPADIPEVRVVTHPEELRTHRDPLGAAHDDVVFRVYAYTTDPDDYSGDTVMPTSMPIVLQVMGVNLTDGANRLIPGVELENLRGGVMVNGTTDYFDFAPSKHYDDVPLASVEMRYWASYNDPGPGQEKYTLICLYSTPVVAPLVVNSVTAESQGVANNTSARLYDMEYVPSSPGAMDFSQDLAFDGVGPKNTARWRLKIPGSVLASNRWVTPDGTKYTPAGDVRLTVKTRILSSLMGFWNATGTLYPVLNEPENLSETYTWWADSIEDVPFTERSQFLGDPRHNPYKDLLSDDPDFPDAYNRFFDSLQNGVNEAARYPGLKSAWLRNRWQGYLRQDVGRYFELLRTGLVRSGAVYNTLTGWSYYYMGHGAEIGYDSANGYPNSIPVDMTAFGGGGNGFINNITGSRRYVRNNGVSGKYWWGMPWLGELCPDSDYLSQWLALDGEGKVRGNLNPGSGNGDFHQQVDNTVYSNSRNVTAGTSLHSAHQRLKPTGCGMFFNTTGDPNNTFNHKSSNGSMGSLVGPGLELANNYNLDLPTTTEINRPFSLTASNNPDGWDAAPYSGNRCQATLIRIYYDSPDSGYDGSGLVELMSQDGSASSYVVVNGLAQTTQLGTGTLAKYSLLTLIHSYFESGDTGLTNRIQMMPRVELVSPTEITEVVNPMTIDLTFDIQWQRWDGQKYTESTPDTFAEADSDIDYFLMYSRDNGQTWLSVLDDSVVEPNARPTDNALLLSDFNAGPEVHVWPTSSATFPAGSYMVRVEAYRRDQTLHYSYHQRKIFVDR